RERRAPGMRVVALAAVAIALATAPVAHAARAGGTLVYAASADAVSLDPPNQSDSVSAAGILMLYEGLVSFTAEMAFVPRLAESWSVSRDGLTWTFRLRRGVTFHDGAAFTAQAVKYTFDRILGVGGETVLRANLFTPYVKLVEAPDAQTVRFR